MESGAATAATPAEGPAAPAEGRSGPLVGSEAVVQPAQEAGEPAGEGDVEGEAGERDPESGRYLSREAARYRTALRTVEAERDTLRERVEQYERAQIEAWATEAGLADGRDVRLGHPAIDAFRDEAGELDREVVAGVVKDTIKSRPGLAAPQGSIGIGTGNTAGPPRPAEPAGLSALLKAR